LYNWRVQMIQGLQSNAPQLGPLNFAVVIFCRKDVFAIRICVSNNRGDTTSERVLSVELIAIYQWFAVIICNKSACWLALQAL